MEQNVNKIASWEDVLSDNYNAEPQAEQVQETVQPTGEETPQAENTTDAAGNPVEHQEQQTEQVEEQVGEQQYEAPQYEYEEEDDYYEPQYQAPVTLEDLDEDTIYEYLSIKKTNYDEVNDIDVVAGFISSENPKWDTDDIEFELEQKYGSALFEDKIDLQEIDKDIYPDEYKEAVKINKEIDRAQKLLKRDALDKRAELEDLKQNIQLPTSGRRSDDNVNEYSAETTQQGLSQEQIQYLQQQWLDSVERDVPGVNEFKFNLGDEEVSYKVTEVEQQQLVQKMRDFNAENYLVDRGWVNQDGTPNVKKITEDVYILENAEKMFKSGWTQAKEKAKMDIIGKDIKNINLGSPNTSFDAKGGNPYDFGDYVLSL
jgi:hypothetical protein